MNSKQWLRYLLLLLVGIYFCFAALHYLVDPFGNYDYSITKYRFAITKAYSKKQFEMLRNNPFVLAFGNSRMARISEEMIGEKVLNFANLYSQPGDIYNFLKQLDQAQLDNIKYVLYLYDVDALKSEPHNNTLVNYHESDQLDRMESLFLLNKYKIEMTLKDIFYNYIRHPQFYIDEYGSSIAYRISTTYQNHAVLDHHKQAYDEEALKTFLKINDFFMENKIKVIYYAPTLMDIMFAKVDLMLEKEKMKTVLNGGVQQVCAPYFVKGVSDLKEGNHYFGFSSASHLNGKYLQTVIEKQVLHCDESNIVDRNNIDLFFNRMLELQVKVAGE